MFFKTSVGFEMSRWINCHWRWNAFRDFQWFSVTGASLGRRQCGTGAGWEGLAGGYVLEVCERAAGAGKNFQPTQDSSG